MEIVAHRGLHASGRNGAPENSTAAVRAAIEAGCRYIEVDVRRAGDGTLLLLHDARVDRMTNGVGRLDAMGDIEVRELRLRDGSPLPHLEAILALRAGRAVLCIDVKDSTIGPAVVEAVAASSAAVEVWSSHGAVVACASDAGLTTAYIHLGLMPSGGPEELCELAHQLGAAAISFFPADIEPDVVGACHEAGLGFMCGTPNDTRTWRALAEAGARAIITDDPLRCAAELGAPMAPRERA